ncbi:MAG: DUF1801 domain-containing protein [Candidatus Nanopelagicales bacterium]
MIPLPKSVKDHYSKSPLTHQPTMFEMRARILEIVPDAEEVVSYGMPAFKVNGNIVAGLLANKTYVGYYPFSGSVLQNFSHELSKYTTTKSALHIPLDQPLPKALIKKLIRARLSECPVAKGTLKLSTYEKKDTVWRELKIAAPARRALVNKKLYSLQDLKNVTEDELLQLHGFGPNALLILKKEMKKKSIRFNTP